MNKDELINNILHSSAAERASLVREFVSMNIKRVDYMDILLMEHPISTRFSWFLNDVSFVAPENAPKTLEFCYKNRNKIIVKDIDRVIAKQSFFCASNLPEKLEGEIVDSLFNWLQNPQKSISTREYALKALDRITMKYPDLLDEFHIIVNNIATNREDDLCRKTKKFIRRKIEL